jgi:hypothetical protein
MDCAKAKELLSAYLDNMLEPEEKAQLEQHAASCVSCTKELALLEKYAKTMAGLPRVKPPDDFLNKVQGRIDRRSEFESVAKGFFKPSAVKTRAVVLAVTVVAVIAVYRIMAPQLAVFSPAPMQEKNMLEGRAERLALLKEKQTADLVSRAPRDDVKETGFESRHQQVRESLSIARPAVSAVAPEMKIAKRQDIEAQRTVVIAEKSMSEQQMAISSGFGYIDNAAPTAPAASSALLRAKLKAAGAAASGVSLDNSINKITQIIIGAGGRMLSVGKETGNQARLKFKIPAAAYDAFIKQLKQFAAVEIPNVIPAIGEGSIDLDLILSQ